MTDVPTDIAYLVTLLVGRPHLGFHTYAQVTLRLIVGVCEEYGSMRLSIIVSANHADDRVEGLEWLIVGLRADDKTVHRTR